MSRITSISGDVAMVGSAIRQQIQAGQVDARSAVAIIRAVGDLCKRAGVSLAHMPEVAEAVVVEVAKGKDGILGTADDLISSEVLSALQSLVGLGMVRELAAWACERAPVVFEETARRCRGCLPCLPCLKK